MSKARFWRDPALPIVESRLASDSSACYRPHSHDTWSIGVVDQGDSDFSCPEGMRRLTPGTLVAIPARRIHACNPLPGRAWSYQMLYLDTDWMEATVGALPDAVLVRSDETAYRAFRALNRRLFEPGEALDKRRALEAFLRSGLWRGKPLVAACPSVLAPPLEAIRRRLETPRDEKPSLPELAAEAGLSRYQLIRRFHRAMGMTPHAFLLDRRIDHARRLLRQGHGPAEVAFMLGFADQSHFHRTFKERVAVTPGFYRRPM